MPVPRIFLSALFQRFGRLFRAAAPGVARGVSLFLGLFSLLNILGELRTPGFDANGWWIDFRPLPRGVACTVLALSAGLLIAFALKPKMSVVRRLVTVAALSILIAVTGWNTVTCLILFSRGNPGAWLPVPLSALFSGVLVFVAAVMLFDAAKRRSQRPHQPQFRADRNIGRLACGLTFLLCAAGFPLAQMFGFGGTNYSRKADAIVVFGARVFKSGKTSAALAERVHTACRLYREGWAPRLSFSGGPGPGKVDEPEGMRRLALQLGVPDQAITLDRHGMNTQATVNNTISFCRASRLRKVLVVSHFYHLPRVKLTYQRAGWNVYTVPAAHRYILPYLPWYIVREVAALWLYYLRPLA